MPFFWIALALFLPFTAFAEPVKVSLSQESPASLTLNFEIEKGWHIYGNNTEVGIPLEVRWDLPKHHTVGEPKWPEPIPFTVGDITGYGYEDSLSLSFPLSPPADSLSGEVHLSWLACSSTSCQPGETRLSLGQQEVALLTLPPIKQPSSEISGLGMALAFAFLGGMLLNLMPCVLPVLSFKIMHFVKMAGEDRSVLLKQGGAFSLGVLLSFWALAAVMLVLRSYGEGIGWGFQLQEPFFVIVLASLLFVFALSLFGVFEWGLSISSWAGEAEVTHSQSGYSSSFFSGVLATAVATPCTGPFLGSAVAFAFTLPVLGSMAIFTSLALGLCAPYLLGCAFPSLLRFLPRPGPWMETFKELMGFSLLATVLWLLWVFSAQTDALSVICALVGFFCFAVGAWIYGRGSRPTTGKKIRRVAYVVVFLCAWMGGKAILLPSDGWTNTEEIAMADGTPPPRISSTWEGWEPFSMERLEALRKEGRPVLIDFTAKWCLICQSNHLVFSTETVKASLKEKGVVKMQADWTKKSPAITKALEKFGRNSVPLYLLYGEEEEPVVLPQVLTPEIVLQAVRPLRSNVL